MGPFALRGSEDLDQIRLAVRLHRNDPPQRSRIERPIAQKSRDIVASLTFNLRESSAKNDRAVRLLHSRHRIGQLCSSRPGIDVLD